MNASKKDILTAFNNQYIEFLNDLERIFPNEDDIKNLKTTIVLVRKTNPKKLVDLWKMYINDKYLHEINKKNFDFFLHKDYVNDLTYIESTNEVLNSINKFKKYSSELKKENLDKTMQYLYNLSQLCNLYYS